MLSPNTFKTAHAREVLFFGLLRSATTKIQSIKNKLDQKKRILNHIYFFSQKSLSKIIRRSTIYEAALLKI